MLTFQARQSLAQVIAKHAQFTLTTALVVSPSIFIILFVSNIVLQASSHRIKSVSLVLHHAKHAIKSIIIVLLALQISRKQCSLQISTVLRIAPIIPTPTQLTFNALLVFLLALDVQVLRNAFHVLIQRLFSTLLVSQYVILAMSVSHQSAMHALTTVKPANRTQPQTVALASLEPTIFHPPLLA